MTVQACTGPSDCLLTQADAPLVVVLLASLVAFLVGAGVLRLFDLAAPGGAFGGSPRHKPTGAAISAAQAQATAALSGRRPQSAGGGAPGNNLVQSKRFSDAIRAAERRLGGALSRAEIREAHDGMGGRNLGDHEITFGRKGARRR
jgi:hypothetical protein